jgi:hypothetical protein
VHDAICRSLEAGNYREPAALAAGVSERSFYSWLERGEADVEAGRNACFSQFFQAVRACEASAETRAVQVLADSMATDWRAAEAYLRSKYPSRWGRRERHAVEHSVEIAGTSVMSAEEAIDELESLAAMTTAALNVARGPDSIPPPPDA